MKRIGIIGLSLFVFLTLGSHAMGQIKLNHVEPPFWWSGMQNEALQIMVHGTGIGTCEVRIDHPGVTVDSMVNPPNANFKIIYLSLSKEFKPGAIDLSFYRDQKLQAELPYQIRQRQGGSAVRKGFNSSDVIYLITPDRFANGNPDNDRYIGMLEGPDRKSPMGRHGGDLKGISDHLDYFKNLGITSVWLNPVLENNQPAFSYHGYSITDFYRVDPRMGTNEEYAALSHEASKRGIGLIMDQVMNHCGSGHWWMKDMPYPDWLRTSANYGPTNHRRTSLNDPYVAASDRDGFVKGWFVPTMPDMNQDNPHLARYLIQNSIWWIEFANLNGIRHDTHSYAGARFMGDWTCAILNEYPDFNIVGEEWSENPVIVSKWQKGYAGPAVLKSCLPSLMDFPLQSALAKALTEGESWSDGFIKLYEILGNDFLYPNPGNLVVFPDNHDMDRFFTQVNRDPGLFRMGLTYILTTRGIPQIFYGTEIMMSSPRPRNDGLIRSDFPGGWPDDPVNAFTGAGLTMEQAEMKDFVTRLLNWRKDAPVIHTGKLMHFSPEDGVYVYFRYDQQSTVMVVLNKSEKTARLKLSKYQEVLRGRESLYDVLTGETISGSEVVVPPKSPRILEVR